MILLLRTRRPDLRRAGTGGHTGTERWLHTARVDYIGLSTLVLPVTDFEDDCHGSAPSAHGRYPC